MTEGQPLVTKLSRDMLTPMKLSLKNVLMITLAVALGVFAAIWVWDQHQASQARALNAEFRQACAAGTAPAGWCPGS
jgi:hypothetical protein